MIRLWTGKAYAVHNKDKGYFRFRDYNWGFLEEAHLMTEKGVFNFFSSFPKIYIEGARPVEVELDSEYNRAEVVRWLS